MSITASHIVRVEKGQASPEEVAAVTAILLARASVSSDPVERARGAKSRNKAGWRRLERTPGFHAPHSWQH
ncbi:acyl-CoA carboxylase subunit epsilon [Streptomyces oceani]|uniref:Acyl-CoA carboxylase subunit epsilon n=1 Tax=Streptomyces oceani TaxID=1075402 RepID=A0A1E7KNF9_9ACTN|nr:acyl-CoA carboxylase subunit epsilon [Streptomyces oceani]OEV05509.1 hypothetical protein AN216_02870 [Streptomyces oceani]